MNTQEEEKNICLDYEQNHLSISKLCKKYHHGQDYIYKILNKYNINHKHEAKLSLQEEQIICDIYKATGRSSECCTQTHHGQDVVRRCLQKHGLYRTPLQAVNDINKQQRKYPVNDDFFKTQTHDMAYMLGFLAADGNIAKRDNCIKIGISAKDKDFLNIFYNNLGGAPIYTYTNSDGYDCASWQCHSKTLKEDLALYNIIPEKTFKFEWPTKLERKYWLDYIRGYFDGDGCVSTAGPNAIRWQVCSATKTILEQILDFFESEYNIPKVSIQTKMGKHPTYYIQYSSVPTRAIYDIFYPEGCLYLPRKKQKFQEIYYKNLKK